MAAGKSRLFRLKGNCDMPSTFGSFVVYKDEKGVHIAHTPPKNLGESETERTQYSGPTVIMPETVPDLNKWLAARRKEGFTFKKRK
jgi:hypothetical protein